MKKTLLFMALLGCISTAQAQKTFKQKSKSGQGTSPSLPMVDFSKSVEPSSFSRYNFQYSNSVFRENLMAKKDGLSISRDENGMPSFIVGKPKNLSSNTTTKAGRSSEASAAYSYLSAVQKYLHFKNVEEEFDVNQIENDNLNQTHIHVQQMYKGIPVYGAQIMLHTKDDAVEVMNGKLFPTPSLASTEPSMGTEQIASVAIQDVQQQTKFRTLSFAEKALLKYEKPQSKLFVYHKNESVNDQHLTYEVVVRPNFLERWIYMIDANSGEILDKYSYTCTLDGPQKANAVDLNGKSRSINTYLVGSNYYMIDASKSMYKGGTINVENPQGVLWTLNAAGSSVNDVTVRQVSSTNNTWTNTESVSAHYNASLAYDYYEKTFGRKSLNGKGGSIISLINLTDEDGKAMDNAFWNGEFMGYGRGATMFKPLAGGLDVAGHEMTHGVVENTANLVYRGQSGAINESMADIFGAMIDRDDWFMGEDVVKGSKPLRDLSNPNQGGSSLRDDGFQPASMNQYYTGSEDNYGVHINSGIVNYAYYRFATSINSKEKAEAVYYRTLTKYLTSSSKFLDLRRAVIQSATDLYGTNSAEANAAKSAFDAVGITDSNPPNTTPNTGTTTPVPAPSNDVPTKKGSSFILSYDPKDKSLYVLDTVVNTSTYVLIAKNIELKNKPSVTDDGKYAYFVKQDNGIYRIDLSTVKTFSPNDQSSTIKQELISAAGWDNVAVSKDGKRLAAITTKVDTSIYVYDLSASGSSIPGRKFRLYNPTYSGVKTGQVLYADSFEWDYDGENLVYDAFNQYKTATNSKIEYWDVGFINVWSNQKNTFGTGIVNKLINDLVEGENVGSPAFSKNSTNMLAFDYFYSDSQSDDYAVLGVNLSRPSDLQITAINNTIGYPEFSRSDDYVIFNALDAKTGQENTDIIQLDKNDKRVGIASTQKTLTQESSFAVWYTNVARTLPQKKSQALTITKVPDKTVGDAAFTITASSNSGLSVITSVLGGPASISSNRITLNGTAGRVRYGAYQDGNTQYYAVSQIDSFCVNPAKPTISVVKKTDANGDYWEYTSSATTGNVWYRNGTVLSDQIGLRSIAVTSGSSFTVQVVTTDGCKSVMSDARQDAPIGKVLGFEPLDSKGVIVSPNPIQDMTKVQVGTQNRIESIHVINVEGNILQTIEGNKQSEQLINLQSLPAGNYILDIKTKEGNGRQKVIKL
ncbi:M4 family metallopeptidase [Flectobacillus longus]|uniref:M4 family metallopeptidase n=1 Tax=Flectobacillus longus TaxID=2984207 RepID=UPI0024B797AC|nr:M4 family metallopeptidase [Flectobacillus longus]MDI9881311.1 M4 family metallopeptidase [Flectobacillus longus]